MGKKYLSPPIREDFDYFTDFSDFQIVALCEMELLRDNKKFKRSDGTNPNQLLIDFINTWKEKEFTDVPFKDRASFQVDIQKIIPFKWKIFGDMANKNHLEVFKNKLTDNELSNLESIFSQLEKMWEKGFKEYKSISILTDEEILVKWNEEKGMYDEIR